MGLGPVRQPTIIGTFEPCLALKRCSGCKHMHECIRSEEHIGKSPWHRCRCGTEWR